MNATSSINALKEVEEYSGVLVRPRAEAGLSAANANLTRNIIVASLVLLLILFVVTSSIRDIVHSINWIKGAAE